MRIEHSSYHLKINGSLSDSFQLVSSPLRASLVRQKRPSLRPQSRRVFETHISTLSEFLAALFFL
jgi:hypothetical protein